MVFSRDNPARVYLFLHVFPGPGFYKSLPAGRAAKKGRNYCDNRHLQFVNWDDRSELMDNLKKCSLGKSP